MKTKLYAPARAPRLGLPNGIGSRAPSSNRGLKIRVMPVGSALALMALVGSVANAATITRTYDITASGFQYTFGPTGGTPVDPVTEDITVTFDPSVATGPTSAGLTITNFNLPYSSEFTYTPGGVLTVATDPISGGFLDTPNTYGLFINDPLTTVSSIFFAQTNAAGETWSVSNIENTAIPEPATWAMMLLGLFGLGAVLRRARVRPALA